MKVEEEDALQFVLVVRVLRQQCNVFRKIK